MEETNQEILEFVTKVINYKFELGLQGGSKIESGKGPTIKYDLFDKRQSFYVVINSNYNITNRFKVVNDFQNLREHLLQTKPLSKSRIALIILEELSDIDKNYFAKEIKPLEKADFILIDLVWLIQLANEYKVSIPKIISSKIKLSDSNSRSFNAGETNFGHSNNEKVIENDITSTIFPNYGLDDIIKESVEYNNAIEFIKNIKGKFWWLNADEVNWPIEEAVEGQKYYYPKKTTLKSGAIRVRNSFNLINIGDLVLTYQKSPIKKLAGIYKVIKSDNQDTIAFQYIKPFSKSISWDVLVKMPFFKDSVIKK